MKVYFQAFSGVCIELQCCVQTGKKKLLKLPSRIPLISYLLIPLGYIYYLPIHHLQIKWFPVIKLLLTAFPLGKRHWERSLHLIFSFTFFFFTCINVYFPSFRCISIHTLLCLAEFHSSMALQYEPYCDDLGPSRSAGESALGRGVSANHCPLQLLTHCIANVFLLIERKILWEYISV